jgi:26S proteasome non-ATPase regulatory subunit 5
MEAPAMEPGEMEAMLRAAAEFASYPGAHGDDTVRQFLEQYPLPKLLGALQSEADVPGMDETIAACLDKVFSSRYGASFLPSYGVCVK